jgi:hypothetical protein
MQHCYICGASIPGGGYRRVVETGSSRRTYYGRRISWSRSRSEGLRTVCQSCAQQIDKQRRIGCFLQIVAVLFVVGFLAVGGNNNSNDSQDTKIAPGGMIPDSKVDNNGDTSVTPVATPSAPIESHFITKDGYDALGYNLDITNMPLHVNTPSDCREACTKNLECKAFVFNKNFKSCFLKRSVGTFVQNEAAYLGYSEDEQNLIRVSPLRTLQGIGFVGYLSGIQRGTRWSDCALDCDEDLSCVAFNYDNRSRDCVKFRSVIRKLGMPTISSGEKSSLGNDPR